MDAATKELLVARILAGCVRFKVITEDSKTLTIAIRKPPLEQLYIAQELYHSYKQEMEDMGAMSEDKMTDFMISQGLWSAEEQKTLDEVTKHIEDFKVKLYEITFKSNEKKTVRKALAKAKEVFQQLSQKKQSYNYLTTTGAASLLRSKYIIGMSLYYLDGTPVYDENSFWTTTPYILDQAVEFYYASRMNESTIREIARTDPWRSIWNSKKCEGRLFGLPSAELSDEQRNVVIWSGIYDSIYEHPDCPPDDIVEDDDILDGWMIIQRRKRKENSDKRKAENMVDNEKIRNSGEVFIPADTIEDAKAINALNDDHAKIVKRQRLATARKHGVVHEAMMPDAQMEIQQELNRKFIESARGKG